MEHVAWKGHIKPGYKQEYIRRHNEIWPEMVDALKAAGVCNYTIFACGDAWVMLAGWQTRLSTPPRLSARVTRYSGLKKV